MIRIVEGLCYLHPHKREIVETHPAMKGVWITCAQLAKVRGTYLAPLLVDDLIREASPRQTVDSIIMKAIGRPYSSLPWLAESVFESTIAERYQAFGCKEYDALYHRDVMMPLTLIDPVWEWIVVHPESFKDQQAGMLGDLWKLLMPSGIRLPDAQRGDIRDEFLGRFTHHWVGDDGKVSLVTKPVYKNKKIIHEPA